MKYTVALEIVEKAKSPEDAAFEVAIAIDQNSAFSWVYTVVGEDGKVHNIDMAAVTEYDSDGEAVLIKGKPND